MEEQVGALWHRMITRAANNRYPEAEVTLQQQQRTLSMLFRALGGEAGIELKAISGEKFASRRNWLQRIAGPSAKIALAWCDGETLHLPRSISLFNDSSLNRDLYLWLVALAATENKTAIKSQAWLAKNQTLTLATLGSYPALKSRYQRLAEAHCNGRPKPNSRWSVAERAQEMAIVEAILNPGSVKQLPAAEHLPSPVPLWLHPSPPRSTLKPEVTPAESESANNGNRSQIQDDEEQRRSAERVDSPEKSEKGLLAIRMENIFSWGEFINLDRSSEENDDLENASDTAEDMEKLAISRDGSASAGKVRFDLDLPSEANDDAIQGEGILLPEWNYRKQLYHQNHCRLVPMIATDVESIELPTPLQPIARRLRAQFQHLAPTRVWQKGQSEGSEIDIDAYLRFASERASGSTTHSDQLYRDLRSGSRDLACLLLADLSLSTDSWINDHARVIDVIRDSLYLFAESLAATQDRFAIYGFSSRRRDPIRFHHIKAFEESYSGLIRGRIGAITPGYYTRMGAAIRHGTTLLQRQPANRRLLLILSDGKPNDLDHYEGRYGIEDTRQAIHEARKAGLIPFCVTIDKQAKNYLPHLFGSNNFTVIHNPAQLPTVLPQLYMQLTCS